MHALLAARTDFSIGESILSPEALVEEAKKVGATAVAITDTMSVTGMIDFSNRCKKAEIKPIIGCRLRLVDDPTWRKTKESKKAPPEYFVTAYVLSEAGLAALFRLLSLANSDERFYMVPKLSFDDFQAELDKMPEGALALATGDSQSVLQHPRAADIIGRWCYALGHENTYVTLVAAELAYYDALNVRGGQLAEELGLPTIATRPVFYGEGKADAAEIMSAIARNVKVTELWHYQRQVRDLHPTPIKGLTENIVAAAQRAKKRGLTNAGALFKSGFEAARSFADRVNYVWEKAPVSLPFMAPNEFKAIVEECKKGWSERFSQSVFGHKPSAEELTEIYKPRLSYELSVLKSLGFSGYFLLVQDIVRFAKSNGILVGPGRGSVGGSLVAYLMGITDCDPIRFGLLFERFINPDRIDLPDADLDFMSERRHEVIEYLVEKYGQDCVAGISNFSTLGSPSAIRECGRVFNLAEDEYRCSKYVPKEHGQTVGLEEAAEQVPEIAAFRDKLPALWTNMLALEGVTRNLSQHAAGVVVGGCKLTERAVVERRKGESVVCWDKRIVEDQGLVKVDILGLSTLDLIDLTLRYIRSRHSKRVDLMRIPLDDPKVLEGFAQGKTIGIFQFESGGMRRLLKELGKDGTITFDDITAATALYRPGPMDSGMMDSYYRRKQGLESIEIDHEKMEAALEPTFGVIVYQEQVMQVARDLAGYSMADADKLRKIMGKKLPEEMAKERDKFVDGAVATSSMDRDLAGYLFDKIEKFAGYGFNKSHSVEYTLISYQSMWLKTYYPIEFFAAALSLMKEEKLPALLKEAERLGIEIDLPDINLSTDHFEIVTDAKIVMPFGRIKGLSVRAAKAIVEARAAGPFASIEDFTDRVNKRLVNRSKIEILDKIGAFARLDPTQLPAKHADRIRDQIEYLPGLITSIVPVHRDLAADKHSKARIGALCKHARETVYEVATKPFFGKQARFMAIFDAPTKGEEDAQFFAFGGNWDWVSDALCESDLAREDGYWTGLIKRPKEGKQVAQAEIETWKTYLEKEIEILKPPVIVLLGSQTVRHFFPGFKGKASDQAGKVEYSEKYDANIVIGFNPGEIFHSSEKQADLNAVFAQVASMIDG